MMKGIKIKKLYGLRRRGYSFIENEEGDQMKIYYKDRLLYHIKVKKEGHLKVKDYQKKCIFVCERIDFFLNPIDNTIGLLIAT